MAKFKFLKNQSGVAAIEAAIILPVIILLVIGLLEFGLYFLKTQIALNSIGSVSHALQRSPTDETIKGMARDSGGMFMDLNNSPNYFCAKAYATYDEAEAGGCSGTVWNTADPGSSGEYYVVLRVYAKKIGVGLASGILNNIDQREIIKISPESLASSSGVRIFKSPGACSWTVPDGVTSAKVTIVGAGGGGCGGFDSGRVNDDYNGASGGGGGGIVVYLKNLTPGSTIGNCSVGTGGTRGTHNCKVAIDATSGGNTVFNGYKAEGGDAPTHASSSSIYTNYGGAGGGTDISGGPNKGTANAIIQISGENGAAPSPHSDKVITGPRGGNPGAGVGRGGDGGYDSVAGGAGKFGGGGGGGAALSLGSGPGSLALATSAGGNGGDGIIIIEW